MTKPIDQMDWLDLMALRDAAGRKNKEAQNYIAPYEHRAYAREATYENPLSAIPLSYTPVLYYITKSLGMEKSRSDPSVKQITQSWAGIMDGLGKRYSQSQGLADFFGVGED